MLLPSAKRLAPQSWNTSSGRFQTTQKAEIELNFFEYSNSKRYLAAPDIVEYNKIHSLRVGWRNLPTLRVGTKTNTEISFSF
jgi:hypothetical protein